MDPVHVLSQRNEIAMAVAKGRMALIAKKLRRQHQAPDESGAPIDQWSQTAMAVKKDKLALMAKMLRRQHEAPDESSALKCPMESNCDGSKERQEVSHGREAAMAT